jgi:cellulose synthase/poly-beta-1,6-N-acetylglucosamine synthase-like glycosyltransferase
MVPELLAVSGVSTLLAVHPFTTYPASLATLARVAPRAPKYAEPSADTRVALCVCAYNEARVIRDKAENMLALRRAIPGLELSIYVDAATDGTAEILQQYADRIHVRGLWRAAWQDVWHEYVGRRDECRIHRLFRCQRHVRA